MISKHPCFEIGKGACLDSLETEIGYGTTELITLRSFNNMLPKFLYYITQISLFRIMGADVMTGSAGQKRVPSDYISNFTLGIPTVSEQQEIVNYIEQILSYCTVLSTKIAKEIDLLNEYKISLVSSVVTGKVDVQGIEIPEFEIGENQQDVDETEEIDDVEEVEADS